MTDSEERELRQLLRDEVESWKKRHTNFLVADIKRLDEDSGQTYVTLAECTVFDLDMDYIHALQIAFFAFEDLEDMISPPHYSGRLLELIVKARSICPPAVYYGHETPFQLRSEDKQHFRWFGKEFLNLPMRRVL